MTTSPHEPPAIEIKKLEVTLGSAAGTVNILRGIDLSVQKGDAIGIVGPSGSGKSTLMAVLAGLEKPTSGHVAVAGASYERMTENALTRHRRDKIGVVMQAFHLIPTMTALENVSIPLELAGVPDAASLAETELAAVGLSHRLHHYPAQLSGGEQQRAAIARALAGSPEILFADEPTGNLDGATGQAIIDLLFDLHKSRGATLVLITHDPSLAARCRRVLHLADGRIVSESVNGGASAREAVRA